ncbi:MAG: C25 family cysteine peptidase [Anaerolineae bacterium]|nr:C25 family cysteine peptidase [Anaerolineae bacterium]
MGWPIPQAWAQGREAAVPLIESHHEGLTLTWTLPPWQIIPVQVDGMAYSRLEVEGVPPAGVPGAPQLPLYSALIGLPPGATARLEVLAREVERVPLPYPPLPVLPPRPISEEAPLLTEWSERDPTIYASDAFYPAEAISLSDPAMVRGHRIAALRIYPLRVNPVRGEMEVLRHVQLAVHFSRPALEGALSSQAVLGDPVSQALAGVLLNPEAAGWTDSSASRGKDAQAPQPASVGAQANGGQIKVLVKEPGLYALSFSALQAAGVPVGSIDPATWRMTYGYPRQEVAIQVESGRILFYAAPHFSRYTDTDAYFLSYGGTSGLRMVTRSGDPTGLPEGIAYRTVMAEQNRYYDPKHVGRDGDRWFWDKLQRPDRASASYTIRLETPRIDTPATLTVWLRGYTNPSNNPDHRVRFTFNGSILDEQIWDGARAITATFTVPGSLLRANDNQVGLALPGLSGVTVEGTWLDAIALRYATRTVSGQVAVRGEAGRKRYAFTVNNPGNPDNVGSHRLYLSLIQEMAGPTAAQGAEVAQASSGTVAVYDVTQPLQPKVVTNFWLRGSTLTIGDADTSAAEYLIVPAGHEKAPLALQPVKRISTPSGGADYIVITHPDFAAAAQRLAAHRARQGLRTAVVDVEAIYDTFGAGRMDAQAIRNFLAHAYTNWSRLAPYYVVLLGDGSYDFKNHSGYNPRTYIPPFLADVDPWWGETASDNRLVTLVGSDILPDMLIGRLPANSPAEASAMVDKVIAYENNAVAPWFLTQLIVADNPDDAGDFYAEGDSAYMYAGAPFSPLRLYYGKPATQPHMYADAEVLKHTLIDRINHGASLVTYFGHSSWHQWAVEDLFHLDDVARLNNQTRLPVVLEMTCFTAFFHHPQYPTLDESLVRWSRGGVVAAWGSTGLGVTLGHSRLHHGFYTAVRAGSGGARVGAGTLAGKLAVWSSGVDLDLLDTFTLLGDPATVVRFNELPTFQRVFLPIVLR